MAKKNSGGKAMTRSHKGRVAREIDSRAEANRLAWARRHPARAAEERKLRKALAHAEQAFRHKVNGTVETHARAARARQGAIARLHHSGAINDEQLAAAALVTWVYDRIARDVTVRTASMETRVDSSPHGKACQENLWAVRMEIAYSHWRGLLGASAGPTLDVIIYDRGLVDAAASASMSARRLRRLVGEALTLWSNVWATIAARASD